MLTQGQAYELNVAGYPEGFGGGLRQQQNNERVLLGFWSQLWKGAEQRYRVMEQQLCAADNALQQVEDITKGLPESSSNTQKPTIWGLEQLCMTYGTPTMDIDSDQGTQFTGHEVQE